MLRFVLQEFRRNLLFKPILPHWFWRGRTAARPSGLLAALDLPRRAEVASQASLRGLERTSRASNMEASLDSFRGEAENTPSCNVFFFR